MIFTSSVKARDEMFVVFNRVMEQLLASIADSITIRANRIRDALEFNFMIMTLMRFFVHWIINLEYQEEKNQKEKKKE